MKMIKRDKFGRFVKGQVPWNKNLNGWNAGEKNSMYGCPPHNKGKNKDNYEPLKIVSEKMGGRKITWVDKISKILRGHKVSKETRRKIGKANEGHIVTEKTRKKVSIKIKDLWKNEKYRKNYIEKRAKQIFPIKDTKIEVKIQNFLKSLGIEFFTHQYMKQIKHAYQCDILIPSMNLVIECDGNYWHKYPVGTEIDYIRTKELLEKGFKVLRLWEFEINEMSIDAFKNKLRNI